MENKAVHLGTVIRLSKCVFMFIPFLSRITTQQEGNRYFTFSPQAGGPRAQLTAAFSCEEVIQQ